jgi:ornithine cyclodeaminase
MRIIDPQQTIDALSWGALVPALREMFRQGCEMPLRHHHQVEVPGEPEATMLLMPAWSPGRYAGVKVANVFPGNAKRGLPAVSASYLLMSAATGEMLALIDGGELTARRTAGVSALAASYLAREDAAHLLMVGTGRMALNLVPAHAAVRPIRRVTVWGRDPKKAAMLAGKFSEIGLAATASEDLAASAAAADIISCATLSAEPLVKGDWLKPGTHVDLVGGFRPTMREADDDAVRRATVFVDTRSGAMAEAGDIVVPLAEGTLAEADIVADLYDLCRGRHAGRRDASEITLCKTVGAALVDLAAAILAYERSVDPGG